MSDRTNDSVRWELALVIPGRQAAVTLAELIDRVGPETDVPEVDVDLDVDLDLDLDQATIVFETGRHGWIPFPVIFGDLGALGRQCGAAADRLRAGEIAIVRSAVDDRDGVSYFLFEPDGRRTLVSRFAPPSHLQYIYPTSPARGAELYAFVADHRDDLVGTAGSGGDVDVRRVPCSGDAIATALQRESDRARTLIGRMVPEADLDEH